MFVHLFIIGLFIVQIDCYKLPVRPGYTLQGAVTITTFISVSLEQCQDLCLSRKKCLSMELVRSYGLCRLSSSDSSSEGVKLIRKPGTFYSEKTQWSKKTIDQQLLQCTNCATTKTCFVHGSSATCSVTECAPPEVLDPNSNVIGNKRTVGAKILHKCNEMNVSITSVCGENGQWSEQQFDCYLAYLEGKQIKVATKENNKYWHFNGLGQTPKEVSVKWQPNDNFAKFIFEKQMDRSFKIKSVAKPTFYMYDGFGVPEADADFLYGKIDSDDDHMRYIVSMETKGYYRIQTKATGRYVRLDTDKYFSSKKNVKDARSLFKLEEM